MDIRVEDRFCGNGDFLNLIHAETKFKEQCQVKGHLLDQHPSGYVVRVEESFGKWVSG